MRTYIARRIVQGLLVLWLVSLLIFSLVRILPGDAVIMQLDQAAAPTPEVLKRARQELGLDRPFLAQYRTWVAGAVQGDLGRSLITRRPVTQELLRRINLTTHLAVLSVIIALLIALPIGVLSAVRQDTASDYLGRLFAILGLSLPDFWLATVAITFLAIWFQWIPPIGFAPLWEDPARCLSQLLIPALIIGARLAAVSMRMTRSSLLEVLRQDYIRTARAKGARERAVIVRHALKNAFIPVVTVIGRAVLGAAGRDGDRGGHLPAAGGGEPDAGCRAAARLHPDPGRRAVLRRGHRGDEPARRSELRLA